MKPGGVRSLSEYIYKTIRVKTKDGRTLEGDCVSFTDEIGSDSGFEEITIDYETHGEVVDESEIEEITVLS